MAAREVQEGMYIATEGQALDAIHIIATGSVKASFSGTDITLKKGDVIGLCDIAFDSHFFSYKTLEKSSFISFPLKDRAGLMQLLQQNPEVARMILNSTIGQISSVFLKYAVLKKTAAGLFNLVHASYNTYVDICSHNNVISRTLPQLDSLKAFTHDEDVPDWLVPFYNSMREFSPELKMDLAQRSSYLLGFLYRASIDAHSCFNVLNAILEYNESAAACLMNEGGIDLFDLYTSLLYRLPIGSTYADQVEGIIQNLSDISGNYSAVTKEQIETRVQAFEAKYRALKSANKVTGETEDPVPVAQDLAGSMDVILEYSLVSDDTASDFKGLVNQYKKLRDKSSTEDSARKLRLELTKVFFQVYAECVRTALADTKVPPIIKMFINFGYVDEELAGMENANFLYTIADTYNGDPDNGIYTIFEWFKAIYDGRKEPCRNELDSDYSDHLRELRMQGKITVAQENEMLSSPVDRVLFELHNVTPTLNKVTYGRLSTYCPVFSESDVIKPLNSCIVTPETVFESIRRIEAVDYSAFYREVLYVNEIAGINKEYINVRVNPDVILLPNVGTRGVMWQEIEGKRRSTPARFALSAFHLEDLPTTITRLTGEYRWEMCKRIQGARWNDPSEKSLTSDYFDYVQFYRKNSDLSQDAKEKIKASMVKAKNSFKEMFVRDYIVWVVFEGQGAPRLNKVVRQIMVTYCPFPKALRTRFHSNPMFGELIDKYEIKTQQKLHHFDGVLSRITNSRQDITPELELNRKFIEGTIE